MSKKVIRSVIDAGNTRVKIAQFKDDTLVSINAFNWDDQKLYTCIDELKETPIIYSSVASESKNQKIFDHVTPDIIFTQETNVPIELENYKTIHTLGTDRIANAVAGDHMSSTPNSLIIDCGTCIKFDAVADKKYIGGSISPGIQMRFDALHQFTGKLPLIHSGATKNINIIGNSTESSMISGVLNGSLKEIEGFIEHYAKNYEELTIFLTGGDAKLFDLHNKNTIFVDSYLTLKGLLIILNHNGY
jgi:type III pantothenate kinase